MEKADFDVEKALEGKGGLLPGRRIFVATTALISSSLVLATNKNLLKSPWGAPATLATVLTARPCGSNLIAPVVFFRDP